MNVFLLSGSFFNSNLLILFCSIYYTTTPSSNISHRFNVNYSVVGMSTNNPNTNLNLEERFHCFAPLNTNAVYTITICADIPDNGNANRVHVGQQPGHVFLILEKSDGITPWQSKVQVFGFYPQNQHSSLLAGDVSCKIVDNSKREYNASLSKKISSKQFQLLLEKSEHLARRKYNLHRFNCYDYVLEVFNSLPGIEKLPITHVKLPYFLGRAGSPCGLYHDLKNLKANESEWAPYIQFGTFNAPESSRN